jgi:phospho-N-acetylmuramoyl-pentapeptide-transferase
MLYHLAEYLQQHFDIPGLGVMRYTSFRAAAATVLSLIITLVFGGRIITQLKRRTIGESIRDLGLQGQMEKKGTPTMGGLIITLGIVVPCLLFAQLNNIYIQTMLLCTVWMAAIGFLDDYIKVFKRDKEGLKAKFKIIGQVGFGIVLGAIMLWHPDIVVRLKASEANGYAVEKRVMIPDHTNNDRLIEAVYVKAPLTNMPFLKGNEYDY